MESQHQLNAERVRDEVGAKRRERKKRVIRKKKND